MTWEVLMAALRVIAWAGLLGGVAPQVMFRRVPNDSGQRVARVILIAAVASTVLWLVGQLSLATLLLAIGCYWLGSEIRHRPKVLTSLLDFAYLRSMDSVHRPSEVKSDVVHPDSLKSEDEKEESDEERESPKPSFAQVVWQRRRLVVDSVAVPVRFVGMVYTERVRPFNAGILAFGTGIVLAVGTALVRVSSSNPWDAQTVDRILAVEGLITQQPEWLADVVLGRLVRAMTFAHPVAAPLAICALLTFVAAWSGIRFVRTVAPEAPQMLGVIAGGLPTGVALCWGSSPTLGLLICAVVPWACVVCGSVSGKAAIPVSVMTAAAFVHPWAVLGSAGAFLFAYLALRAESKVELSRGMFVWAAIGMAVLGFAFYMSASPTAVPEVGGSEKVARAFAVVGGIEAIWLLLGGLRDRSSANIATGRALALVILAVVVLPQVSSKVVVPNYPAAAATLLAMAGTLMVADLRKLFVLRHRFARAGLAMMSVVLSTTLAFAQPSVALGGKTIERQHALLAFELFEQHMAWNFTVIAPRSFLPLFGSSTWYIPTRDVPVLFPAKNYHWEPGKEERVVGTEYTYVVVPRTDPVGAKWVQELITERSYPRPVRVHGFDRFGAKVFRLKRNKRWEEKRISASSK